MNIHWGGSTSREKNLIICNIPNLIISKEHKNYSFLSLRYLRAKLHVVFASHLFCLKVSILRLKDYILSYFILSLLAIRNFKVMNEEIGQWSGYYHYCVPVSNQVPPPPPLNEVPGECTDPSGQALWSPWHCPFSDNRLTDKIFQ